jgi:hemerythrin-like domain-containing protein
MTDAPDLTQYRVIHHCLRIAAHRMADALREVTEADRDQARALARYWAGYAGEVLAHHTIEDDVFFPRLVERVPVAAEHIARVDSDHHHLDDLMDRCTRAFAGLAASPSEKAAYGTERIVRELADHMDSHLDFEDEDLLPLFGRHFTAAEYLTLEEQAMKHLGIGKQAAFTVPFVMHWAPPAERADMLTGAPLAMRVLFRLTRAGHARLTQRALGAAAAVPQEVRL